MTSIPFDIVGFDLDGTLLDTSEDLAAAVNHALARIGCAPLSVDQVRPLIGRGARAMLQQGLDVAGVHREGEAERLLPVLLDFYEDNIARHTAPYAGLVQALDALDAMGVKLAICTNKREGLARKLIDLIGWSDRFAAVVGGDTVGVGKPDPAPIRAMIEQAGGGRCAFVGDSIFDVEGAHNTGLPAIAVSFGFLNQPVETLGADAIIDHYDALLPTLTRFGTR